MSKYFGWDDSDYTRDLDIVQSSIQQTATGLATIHDKPVAQVVKWMQRKLDTKAVKLRPVRVNAWVKDDKRFGDRFEKQTDILKILKVIEKRELITTPVFTSYDNPNTLKAPTTICIQRGFADRSASKDLQKLALKANDEDGFAIHNGNQNAKKVSINSYSGAAEDAGTPLHCKTIHPSLTGLCRCSTGICTAFGEKSVGGVRNYYSPAAIEEDILGLLVSINYPELSQTISQYQLVIPTVEQCKEHIRKNKEPYFKSESALTNVYRIVDGMDELQRAAFLYYSNLYDLMILNFDTVKGIFEELTSTSLDDEIEYRFDGKRSIILKDGTKRTITGNEQLQLDKMTLWNNDSFEVVCNRFFRWLDKRAAFFSTFTVTKYHLVHLGEQATAVRRVVPLGDTDSCFVAYQRFIRVLNEKHMLDQTDNPILDSLTYLTNESFWHQLRMYSAKMGIPPEFRDDIEMKSELVIPSLELTVVAKTYHAFVNNKEGTHLPEERREFELKGKRFHAGSLPQLIRDELHQVMEDNLIGLSHGKKIDRQDVVARVTAIEQAIINGIPKGESWFDSAKVKAKSGYKNWKSQPAVWTEFWNIFFGERFENATEGEYMALKVPLKKMSNERQVTFLRAIAGDSWKDKWEKWCALCSKAANTSIGSILIPLQSVNDYGIPPEIIPYIDIRLICHNVLDPWYLYLQSMNFFIDYKKGSDKAALRIVSDFTIASEEDECEN